MSDTSDKVPFGKTNDRKFYRIIAIIVAVAVVLVAAVIVIPAMLNGAKVAEEAGKKVVSAVKTDLRNATRAQQLNYVVSLIKHGSAPTAPKGTSFKWTEKSLEQAISDYEGGGVAMDSWYFLREDKANYASFAVQWEYVDSAGVSKQSGLNIYWLDNRSGQWSSFPVFPE